jgi:hypothetical protein
LEDLPFAGAGPAEGTNVAAVPPGSAWAESGAGSSASSSPHGPGQGGSLLGGRELLDELAFSRSRASSKSFGNFSSNRFFSATGSFARSLASSC